MIRGPQINNPLFINMGVFPSKSDESPLKPGDTPLINRGLLIRGQHSGTRCPASPPPSLPPHTLRAHDPGIHAVSLKTFKGPLPAFVETASGQYIDGQRKLGRKGRLIHVQRELPGSKAFPSTWIWVLAPCGVLSCARETVGLLEPWP